MGIGCLCGSHPSPRPRCTPSLSVNRLWLNGGRRHPFTSLGYQAGSREVSLFENASGDTEITANPHPGLPASAPNTLRAQGSCGRWGVTEGETITISGSRELTKTVCQPLPTWEGLFGLSLTGFLFSLSSLSVFMLFTFSYDLLI